MKGFIKLTIGLIAATALSSTVYSANSISGASINSRDQFNDKRPVAVTDSVTYGSYDPHGDYADDGNSKIEHVFLPWEAVDLSSLKAADSYAQERGRSLLVTIEPWSWSRDWRTSPPNLLRDILSGRYDSNMTAVCSTAATLKSPVTIRWAQEMDDKEGQFSWSYWKPEDYIKAYRHVIDICRQHLPNAQYMWSPQGDEGLEAFYPGDDYLDVIGLSVFGYQPFDKAVIGRDTTFVERTKPGYSRVVGFGKPIVIAELGYAGDDDYVRDWAAEANKVHAEFPAITAVLYFNDREVYPWPNGFGRPDWRVASHILD